MYVIHMQTFIESLFISRFMYNGEVHIGQEQLADFLKTAQMLQVRGLADVSAGAASQKLAPPEQKVSPVSQLCPFHRKSTGSRNKRPPSPKNIPTITAKSLFPPARFFHVCCNYWWRQGADETRSLIAST